MCRLAFPFYDAEQLGIGSEVGDKIISLAALVSLGEEVQAAINHLNGDGGEWLVERFGHAVGEIDEDGIEQPSGPDLNLDRILGAAPKNRPGPTSV